LVILAASLLVRYEITIFSRSSSTSIIPHCGHWTMIERKPEFERITCEFLPRQLKKPAGFRTRRSWRRSALADICYGSLATGSFAPNCNAG
jgi:hypothetical protein